MLFNKLVTTWHATHYKMDTYSYIVIWTDLLFRPKYEPLQHALNYSSVPNKRTGRLLENEKKSHLYALIQTYTFINFQQKVPPICLFPLTLLLIFVLSMAHFDLRRPQKPL